MLLCKEDQQYQNQRSKILHTFLTYLHQQYTQEAANTKSAELINDILAAPSTEAASANAQFKLYLDTTGTKGFTFDAIITNATFGTTVGDLTTVSCSFQTCGDISATLE